MTRPVSRILCWWLWDPILRMSNFFSMVWARPCPGKPLSPWAFFLSFFLLGLGVCWNQSHTPGGSAVKRFRSFHEGLFSAHRKPFFPSNQPPRTLLIVAWKMPWSEQDLLAQLTPSSFSEPPAVPPWSIRLGPRQALPDLSLSLSTPTETIPRAQRPPNLL